MDYKFYRECEGDVTCVALWGVSAIFGGTRCKQSSEGEYEHEEKEMEKDKENDRGPYRDKLK
ncbi:hypothetical protein ABVT39_026841 [Epinephelus coioides]